MASQVIGLRTWIFSICISSSFLAAADGDHLVLVDDDLVGDRVDDVDPADPAADRLDEADLDLLALVDDALGDALRGAAVFHGDHDVLGDVGELAGQVAASRPS